MEIGKIDGIKVFIIESLHDGDKRTGEFLRDELRQYNYDYSSFPLDYEYYYIEDENDLCRTLSHIDEDVKNHNCCPIIQLECHGYMDGIELSSFQHIRWLSFFDYIRPINIDSQNLLLLNLSMCNGAAVIRGIDPTKRAPFRGVIGPEDKAYPEMLQNSWNSFYSKYFDSLRKNDGKSICELAVSCGLIYYEQAFIFDVHYDTPNLYPDMFERFLIQEMTRMFIEEGPLMLDPVAYKKWMASKFKEVFNTYKPYHCFYDIREITEL